MQNEKQIPAKDESAKLVAMQMPIDQRKANEEAPDRVRWIELQDEDSERWDGLS